jgi:hypothetical protein
MYMLTCVHVQSNLSNIQCFTTLSFSAEVEVPSVPGQPPQPTDPSGISADGGRHQAPGHALPGLELILEGI